VLDLQIQVSGSIFLAIAAIVAHVANKIPSHVRLKDWLFPKSGAPRLRGFSWFGGVTVTLFCSALGFDVIGRFELGGWFFLGAAISMVITTWSGLRILTPRARVIWTLCFSMLFASLLIAIDVVAFPRVTITPDNVIFGTVPLGGNSLSETYKFRISNTADQDLYEISFKLRVEIPSVTTVHFKFGVPKSSQKPINENTAEGRTVGDIFGADCIDADGRTVFFRNIVHLDPHESREVTLTRVVDEQAPALPFGHFPTHLAMPSDKSGIRVSASIAHYTRDPTHSLARRGLGVVPFYVDEQLKCGAMSVVLLN
jgi:hypothetical protein